jgi:archaellum component FlaC
MFAPACKMAGDLPIQKQKIMNDKNLDRQAENMLDNVNDTISLLVRKIEELEQDLVELEKLYEQVKSDRDEAFDKGYDQGVKFTDDKRFPF